MIRQPLGPFVHFPSAAMIRLVFLFLIASLAACSSTPESHFGFPYKIDIRQGNLVTQDMVAQLKPGQTKDQVRFILGTPLVADMFHADRWDYVYRFQPGTGHAEAEQRHLVVFFEDGKLASDVMPLSTVTDVPTKPAARVIDIAPATKSAN